MYGTIDDPYCYAGTDVLINKLGLRDPRQLASFEHEIASERAMEALPAGRLSASHFLAIHKHLFQDVYSWAGKIRTVRITKDENTFCYPENINGQLRKLFSWLEDHRFLRGLAHQEFAPAAAHFLAELNAIHAFREGNGRTQMAFMTVLAAKAGHPMCLDRLDKDTFLAAMIASFNGREEALCQQIALLTAA